MCTLEEIVELDIEMIEGKQMEELFDTSTAPMYSATPYSDVTQVSNCSSFIIFGTSHFSGLAIHCFPQAQWVTIHNQNYIKTANLLVQVFT